MRKLKSKQILYSLSQALSPILASSIPEKPFHVKLKCLEVACARYILMNKVV